MKVQHNPEEICRRYFNNDKKEQEKFADIATALLERFLKLPKEEQDDLWFVDQISMLVEHGDMKTNVGIFLACKTGSFLLESRTQYLMSLHNTMKGFKQ